jgi:hypothetical protein
MSEKKSPEDIVASALAKAAGGDVAKALLAQIDDALNAAGVPTLHPDIGAAERKPMLLRERVEWLAENKNEARAEAERLQLMLDLRNSEHSYGSNRIQCDFYKKERDEARAELQRLKDDHARTLGEYDAIKVAHEQLKKTSLHDVLIEAKRQRDQYRSERDEARAEVEKLKAELKKSEKAWLYWENKAKSNSMKLRPEPSRLEIAAMIYAAFAGAQCAKDKVNPTAFVAFKCAGELIAAAKEEQPKEKQ